MIQNYDKISRWNIKSNKFKHFEKFIFIQQWLTQNMWSIWETIVKNEWKSPFVK